jgi:uncharacterized repeat protein (TIGR01451 family)
LVVNQQRASLPSVGGSPARPRRAIELAGALVIATAIAVGGSSAVTDAAARGYTNPPDAVDDALTTDEDAAGTVNVLGNDVPPPRGAPLSVTGWTDGAHGTVGCAADGVCTYTPSANYSGPDSFTYTITDGQLGDSATVQVTVGPVNDPPNAVDDVLTIAQNTSGTVDVLANDSDLEGDGLTVSESANGAHGTVTCAASCSYVPAAGYSGPDTFTYTVADGHGGSDSASVSVTVNATAAPPPPPPPPPEEEADVTVTITQEALPASVGARIRYLITVANNGPGVARDVALEQRAPAGGSFESVSTDTGTCSGSSVLTCSFGSLSAGRQAHVTTIAALALGGTATSTANVRSSAPDPRVANNTALATLDVVATVAQADPVFGEAVVPVVVSGFVCVQLPTSDECVDAATVDQIPVGSTVDATRGRVGLTVETAAGTEEKAELYEGQFHVLQSASVTEFRLAGGDFSVCTAQPAKAKAKKATKKRKPAALEQTKPRRPVRRLWGDGEGSFRTSSRYGSATVRGTVWLTEDYCNGTLFRVQRGSVTVLDLLKNRTVVVAAGKSYFAAAPVQKAKAKPKKAKKRKPAGIR